MWLFGCHLAHGGHAGSDCWLWDVNKNQHNADSCPTSDPKSFIRLSKCQGFPALQQHFLFNQMMKSRLFGCLAYGGHAGWISGYMMWTKISPFCPTSNPKSSHRLSKYPFPLWSSNELGWLRSNDLDVMVIGHLDSGSKMMFQKLIFRHPAAAKPRWLRSNGLGAMVLGHLDSE
jgi:hypothetical protein